MLRIITYAIPLICILFSLSSWSKANCAEDLGYLISKANQSVNPSDSDFNAVLSAVRLRAYLILKQDLDNSTEQIWWEPKTHYFKSLYQAKNSKDSVVVLFDRESGLWAYKVKSKTAGSKSICINTHRISRTLLDLAGKKE